MKDFYLTSYSVKGIKTFDKLITLSFYKKTITRDIDTQNYNVKGIYGMNGSGKSAIIESVDILKNILVNPGYLNNPMVQENLNGIINKKMQNLYMEAEFIAKREDDLLQFKYCVTLSKESTGKYCIADEEMACRNALSRKQEMKCVYRVENGEVTYNGSDYDRFENDFIKKTTNLLLMNSMCSLFIEKVLMTKTYDEMNVGVLFWNLAFLCAFARSIHIYLTSSDDHRSFWVNQSLEDEIMVASERSNKEPIIDSLLDSYAIIEKGKMDILKVSWNHVSKAKYKGFEKTVKKLYDFIHIFKNDLKGIEIDKKENDNFYVCNLVMVYDSYRIHAEFESTGVKKLINLYVYFRDMVQGAIVFMDELDSNLHDVYLCALLEYLMEYGQGQLCFTTHNVGPMDVLKQHSKSIDFLSEDRKIYSWKTCGNYSPSKLYRSGMIQGSPFNVDSIDFIGVFDSEEDD